MSKKPEYLGFKPITDKNEFAPYLDMLDTAFEKKLTNIALTGPYGSGKSSIIETYKKYRNNNICNKKRFTHISFSAFSKYDIPNEEIKNAKEYSKYKECYKEYYNNIEKSILQQLFYRVKSTDLPYSRFNKISHPKVVNIFGIVTLLIFAIGIIMSYIDSTIFSKIDFSTRSYIKSLYFAIVFISIVIVIAFFSYGIKFLISKFKISKFGYKSTEITIGKDTDSIFNKYLDEIIYFFHETEFTAVIIEDLDRFENQDIFVKLRELNYLINNSDETNEPIYFIYAVRDELFLNSDRTKFFDIIIPVIPIINYANSSEKLIKLIKNDYNLSEELKEDFIYRIGPHFSDMRILKSALNEYCLYKTKLNLKNLDSEMLFALMLYKNIYSKDFDKLQNNNGILYSAFKNKKVRIDEKINEYSDKIKIAEEKMHSIESEHLMSVEELKGAFIIRVCSNISELRFDNRSSISKTNFSSFNFELLDSTTSFQIISRSNTVENLTKDEFNDRFSLNSLSYFDRYVNLKNGINSSINILKKQILNIRDEINIVQEYSLAEYMDKFGVNEFSDLSQEKNTTLLFLLRENIIKENYIDYISNFYEGKLTSGDMNFILNVHNDKPSDPDYPLAKTDIINNRLETKYFKRKHVLNFDLLSYLIENENKNQPKIDYLFSQLSPLDELALNFINNYFYSIKYKGKFMQILCHKNHDIWFKLKYKNTEQCDINEYMRDIIYNAEIEDIKQIDEYSEQVNGIKITKCFSEHIIDFPDFINYTYSGLNENKITDVIKLLGIKFSKLSINSFNNKIFKFILENGYFQLNEYMIENIILIHNPKLSEIAINYSTIKETKIDPLIKEIDARLDEYLENVYFIDKPLGVELYNYAIEVLNSTVISQEQKKKFICKANFELFNLDNIENNFWSDLIRFNKLAFDWANIFKYYSSFKLDKDLEKYLLAKLNGIDMPTIDITAVENSVYDNFINDIILSDSINTDNIFISFIKNEKCFDVFNLANVDSKKINSLINNGKISFNKENYDFINSNYRNCIVPYIEKQFDSFISQAENLDLDIQLITEILLSKKLSKIDKKNVVIVLNKIQFIPANSEIAAIISMLVCTTNTLQLNEEFRQNLFIHINDDSLNLKLLLNQSVHMKDTSIINALNAMSTNFNKLTQKGMHPSFTNNADLKSLAKFLIEKRIVSSYTTTKKGRIIIMHTFKN